MRFLIVDDDFTSRRLLTRILQGFGQCDTACDGDGALLAFESAEKGGQPYDLILLDIEMPARDGHEVLRAIRRRDPADGSRRTRVAMATAHFDKDNVLGAFRGQCDGYVRKPYSSESLRTDLGRYGLWPGDAPGRLTV